MLYIMLIAEIIVSKS